MRLLLGTSRHPGMVVLRDTPHASARRYIGILTE